MPEPRGERGLRRTVSKKLTLMIEWLDTQPEVPQGKWFKRCPAMIVCGEGELVKTFLLASQSPTGYEIQ